MAENDDAETRLKEQLREELRQELAGQLKEDIMKDIKESLKGEKKERKSKEEKAEGPQLPDVEIKENNAVLSQLGNLPIPKAVLRTLGWGKNDVIELAIENNNSKLVCTRVGHTNTPKQKAKSETPTDAELAAATETPQGFNASKYFEFDFADRHLLTKLRQIIENANQLYEAKNFDEGIKILEMVETIELKEDEPDRSKMRVTVIKYLSEILPANPEAVAEQVPYVLEMIKKISSRYLQEKGYTLLASACKQSEQGYPYFDQIMDVLFGMLLKYQTTELYAIISLLESLIKLARGTTSPFVQKLVEYIKEKFDQIDDNDYKVRFIKLLTSLEAYTDAKELGKAFRATTVDGSGERRAVLDALKENRDAYKAYLEKHPELQEAAEAEDADDYLEELNVKKRRRVEAGEPEQAPPLESPVPKPLPGAAPSSAAVNDEDVLDILDVEADEDDDEAERLVAALEDEKKNDFEASEPEQAKPSESPVPKHLPGAAPPSVAVNDEDVLDILDVETDEDDDEAERLVTTLEGEKKDEDDEP
jgi:bifunctional DNA-binding transcriptional regulator/antitoxin component of YhaV-PrlF toxin-antitoxin module